MVLTICVGIHPYCRALFLCKVKYIRIGIGNLCRIEKHNNVCYHFDIGKHDYKAGKEYFMWIDILPSHLYRRSSKTHLYIRPHPALQKWVAHYTYLQDTHTYNTPFLTLVPDAAGCITMQDTGNGLDCCFWGATTHCVQVPSNQPAIQFHFFVEFHPTAAYAFLHHSQHLYLNEKIPLQDVCPSLNRALKEAYEQCDTLSAFIKIVDQELLKMVEEQSACVRFMRKQLQNGSSIMETMEQTGYSRRHLQRMFLEQMGCSMKEYQRIERINQAVRFLQQGMDGTKAAQSCGYYDQSHFIHDFVQVCGLTPKKYVESLSEFYNEPFKF